MTDVKADAPPYTKLDVQKVLADVEAIRAKRHVAHVAAVAQALKDNVPLPDSDVKLDEMDWIPLKSEISGFGLVCSVHDMVSDKVIVVARPAATGQAGVLLTAEQVDTMVEDAHKAVLAAQIKAAEKALAEKKAHDEKVAKEREAAKAKAEADAKAAEAKAKAPVPVSAFDDSTLVGPKTGTSMDVGK